MGNSALFCVKIHVRLYYRFDGIRSADPVPDLGRLAEKAFEETYFIVAIE